MHLDLEGNELTPYGSGLVCDLLSGVQSFLPPSLGQPLPPSLARLRFLSFSNNVLRRVPPPARAAAAAAAGPALPRIPTPKRTSKAGKANGEKKRGKEIIEGKEKGRPLSINGNYNGKSSSSSNSNSSSSNGLGNGNIKYSNSNINRLPIKKEGSGLCGGGGGEGREGGMGFGRSSSFSSLTAAGGGGGGGRGGRGLFSSSSSSSLIAFENGGGRSSCSSSSSSSSSQEASMHTYLALKRVVVQANNLRELRLADCGLEGGEGLTMVLSALLESDAPIERLDVGGKGNEGVLIAREGGREGRVDGTVLRQFFMVTRRSLCLFKARGVAVDAAVLTTLLGGHERALPLLTLDLSNCEFYSPFSSSSSSSSGSEAARPLQQSLKAGSNSPSTVLLAHATLPPSLLHTLVRSLASPSVSPLPAPAPKSTKMVTSVFDNSSSSITTLDLSGTWKSLVQSGQQQQQQQLAEALADLFRHNTTLQHLILRGDSQNCKEESPSNKPASTSPSSSSFIITTTATVPAPFLDPALAALQDNTSLFSLDFTGLGIGEGGANAFCSVLIKNRTLRELCLEKNGVSEEKMRQISVAIAANHTAWKEKEEEGKEGQKGGQRRLSLLYSARVVRLLRKASQAFQKEKERVYLLHGIVVPDALPAPAEATVVLDPSFPPSLPPLPPPSAPEKTGSQRRRRRQRGGQQAGSNNRSSSSNSNSSTRRLYRDPWRFDPYIIPLPPLIPLPLLEEIPFPSSFLLLDGDDDALHHQHHDPLPSRPTVPLPPPPDYLPGPSPPLPAGGCRGDSIRGMPMDVPTPFDLVGQTWEEEAWGGQVGREGGREGGRGVLGPGILADGALSSSTMSVVGGGGEGGGGGGGGGEVAVSVLSRLQEILSMGPEMLKDPAMIEEAQRLTQQLDEEEEEERRREGGSGLGGVWSELSGLAREMRRSVDLEGEGLTMERLLGGVGEGEVEEGKVSMRDEVGGGVNVSEDALLLEGSDDNWEQGEEEGVGEEEWDEGEAEQEEDDASWNNDDDK